MIALIPMMGLGFRFANAGYSEYKPFVKINSVPLIKKIVKEVKEKFDQVFVVCSPFISEQLKGIFHDEIEIIELQTPTRGAAETVYKACSFLPKNTQIACIDCDTIFYQSALDKVIQKQGSFILTFNDEDKTGLYSYAILNEDGHVIDIQEKKAISELAIAGIYVFNDKSLIENSFSLLENNNTELYISAMIKQLVDNGYKFNIVDVSDEFDCCGTPPQLKQYAKNNIKDKKYTFCFDIDGTLIYDLYKTPIKIEKNVEFCNQAYKDGHKIILHTARGMLSTNFNKTLIEEKRPYIEKILSDNGVLYHELILMKPYADVYIDDKAIPAHKNLEKETGIYLFEEHNSRAYNKIIVDGNRIIKLGNLKGESYYYSNSTNNIKKFFPRIFYSSDTKIEMEKINSPTYSSLLLSKKLTKEDITKLVKTIAQLHSLGNEQNNIDPSWGYKEKTLERFKRETEFYNLLNIDLDKFVKEVEKLKEFNIGIIHGDPVFTNVFLENNFCKFIDVRGIWDNKPSMYGDIFYDYAKILQSLYGYDYALHNEDIESDYLKTLREHYLSELLKIHSNLNIDELIIKTKLLYVTLLPLHKENIKRCRDFIEILNVL